DLGQGRVEAWARPKRTVRPHKGKSAGSKRQRLRVGPTGPFARRRALHHGQGASVAVDADRLRKLLGGENLARKKTVAAPQVEYGRIGMGLADAKEFSGSPQGCREPVMRSHAAVHFPDQ